jgi:hypothetical protein
MASIPSLRPMGGAPNRRAADPSPPLERDPFKLQPAAILALALLTALWTFWGWRKGAYFGTVFLPGLIVLCIGAGMLIAFAPWRVRARLSMPIVVTLSALIGLGLWAVLSALWSPAADLAIADGQRILAYAISFGLGALLCNLLNARMNLALAPVAIAGGLVGLITAFTLLGSSDPRDVLDIDGTLDFPLGYRNADAAFFAICIFPAISLAADRALQWQLRAAALGATTLCIDLVILSQSRASLPALVVSLIVFVLVSPLRVRALSWFAVGAIAALPTIPAMSAVFTAASDNGTAAVGGEMHTAAVIILVTTAVAVALGALAARNEERLPGLGRTDASGNRRVARGLWATLAVIFLAFLIAIGNPVDWVNSRLDEFRSGDTPDLSAQGTRFGLNAGSNRYDAWRVALSDFGDDPIFGDGGGGYRYSYLQKREHTQDLHDAHSVWFENLAELGIVGFGLLLAAVIGAFMGAARARPLGPNARIVSAAALAAGSYWVVHTSLDWFWPYPGISAPVMALLGSAAAPAARVVGRRSTRPWRWWAIGGLAVLAISAIPPYLADRYINESRDKLVTNPEGAIADLNRAQDLNPLDDFPLLRKGFIQSTIGDTQGALASFRAAAELRPEDYAAHYLIAQLEADRNQGLAQNEIRVALELNPLDAKVRQLATQLGIPRSELVPLDQ